ncbi:ABC transporter permease [Cohnella thailandensis]|uniref:ABC transporter permease n=1 Tax=Cohnella thailandensis TaxID=557557 RepID=A0A841T181_9BACL|nr:ABC transporter permease [Cohnella thailandensis]MBB6635617.1 ABC transporter permease [Cohnella thailandensis]MBP1974997.1 simple sugar transport system permease protein [Cohnella thailandensis]
MDWLNDIANLTNSTFVFTTALIFGAMGGLFSERSGVFNIGLEGMMTGGAFGAAIATYYAENAGYGWVSPWIGILAGIACGVLFSLLLAYTTVTLKANQAIVGVVINILAVAITLYLVKVIFDGAGDTETLKEVLKKWPVPLLSDIPFLGQALFNTYPTTYIAYLLIPISAYLLYKTPFGLRLRSVGEHPGAADTVGINVIKYRYIGVIISGVLAGIGGAAIALTTTSNFSHTTVSGQGFIALAAMIFGRWNPWGVLGATFFFGMAQALRNFVKLYDWSKDIPMEFLYMLPYLLTLLVLAGAVGKGVKGPAAAGEAYDPSKR